MPTSDKETNFVLTLPLKVEPCQSDILNKRYEYLRFIYNYVQGKLLRQYRYFEQMDEYRQIKTFKGKRDFFKSHPFNITGILGRGKNLLDITFSEYGIMGLVSKLNKMRTGNKTYKDLGINSINLSALASNIWSSWEKYLYEKGNRIHFKRKGELNTIEFGTILSHGKQVFIGLLIDLPEMQLKVKLNGLNGSKAEWMTIKIGNDKPLTEYETTAIRLGEDAIRTVTIARKLRNGNRKYYAQFTFRGMHDNKKRKIGKGQVGIDIGPSTIAISSLQGVRIDKLANNVDSIEHDKWLIQRKLDRSRRAANPQNYNEDGTIKRGVKLIWNKSNRYNDLQSKLRELQRHQSAVRKQQHIELANELLSLGNVFVVENNPIKEWTARAKETKISEKTGKYLKKKRYGKSVANHAPAEFVTILKNKVEALGGTFVKVDPKNAASRFDFTDSSFHEHKLSERQITLSNGDTHQRDLLAAFNLQHLEIDDKELKKYDRKAMEDDYATFCLLEREELDRYIKGEKKNDKSTINAF